MQLYNEIYYLNILHNKDFRNYCHNIINKRCFLAACNQQDVSVLPQQHKRSLHFTLEQDETSPEQRKEQSDSVGSEVQSVGDITEEVDTAHRDHTDVDIHADACGKDEGQGVFEDDEDSENVGLIGDIVCQCLSILRTV